jgi:hypothetical protein
MVLEEKTNAELGEFRALEKMGLTAFGTHF